MEGAAPWRRRRDEAAVGRCSGAGEPGVTEDSREVEDLLRSSIRLELAEVLATAAERSPYVTEAPPELRSTSELSWRSQTCSSTSVSLVQSRCGAW